MKQSGPPRPKLIINQISTKGGKSSTNPEKCHGVQGDIQDVAEQAFGMYASGRTGKECGGKVS